jgi:predicted ATPase
LARDDLYLSVEGFKAIKDKIELRIAPLTLVSGTNSAGKSSFMQPFLIMKQTLESSFDPGALLLYGPNAKFTLAQQILARGKSRQTQAQNFTVGLRSEGFRRTVTYREAVEGYVVESDVVGLEAGEMRLTTTLSSAAIEKRLHDITTEHDSLLTSLGKDSFLSSFKVRRYAVERENCFLDISLKLEDEEGRSFHLGLSPFEFATQQWIDALRKIIHVPGLRGNPEREYARSAVGSSYPGTFETYVASILLEWASTAPGKLEQLSHELEELGLTWKVMGRKKNDAAVEVLVGRMPHAQQGGALDLVSVADVGFGVSQTLPVIIALLVAQPGQIVYLEQPEIHLHPRAQVILAHALVRAATRGVKVVAETHSSLIIRSVQTLVADGSISASAVSMNWFSRDEVTGFSKVEVADLDDEGRFGDWPLDFDEVSQEADLAYLAALRRRRS